MKIELDEVVISPKKTYKTRLHLKHRKIWHCTPHELSQGGLSDAPTVDVCEWVPFNP